jgi:hypothetical protein
MQYGAAKLGKSCGQYYNAGKNVRIETDTPIINMIDLLLGKKKIYILLQTGIRQDKPKHQVHSRCQSHKPQ